MRNAAGGVRGCVEAVRGVEGGFEGNGDWGWGC